MYRYGFAVLVTVCVLKLSACGSQDDPRNEQSSTNVDSNSSTTVYVAPDTSTIPKDKVGDLIRYGRELILNTSYYFGLKGTLGTYAGNDMACGNCHLDAGTRPYGLNFFSAHARYPQYRAREGKVLSLADRVNNCFERPLNGKPIPMESREMSAILMYMKWLSQGVPVDGRVEGDNLKPVSYPDRPADPTKGLIVYEQHCVRCHADDGQGVHRSDGVAYVYPPLWGKYSYQPGSSMHRLIKSAQFIKYNMPWDLARWDKPVLTDEEAFDVAAYINDDKLHTRPNADNGHDYPVVEERPVDFYYGPYADPFAQEQHKYGPFKPIIDWRKERKHFTGL